MSDDSADKKILEDIYSIFLKTKETLNEWKEEGNLQVPILMQTLALKLNWNEKQLKDHDPLVRFYIKNHPNWEITRGAHGGIMRAEDKQKKEKVKLAKELAKVEMQALIDAEVAKKLAAAKLPETNTETEEN